MDHYTPAGPDFLSSALIARNGCILQNILSILRNFYSVYGSRIADRLQNGFTPTRNCRQENDPRMGTSRRISQRPAGTGISLPSEARKIRLFRIRIHRITY